MAGGIANGQKDRPIESTSALESLFPPRIPVNGIVGVLTKIGAGFVDEAVGKLGCHRRLLLGATVFLYIIVGIELRKEAIRA
jgi:hypothetical protein